MKSTITIGRSSHCDIIISKNTSPRRASQANTIAWIGFIINLLLIWASV